MSETISTEQSEDYKVGYIHGAVFAAQAFHSEALPVLELAYAYLAACEVLLDKLQGTPDEESGPSDITCDLKELIDVIKQMKVMTNGTTKSGTESSQSS